ncbi:hypothetical protein [uncultured Brevundimonas sp.]|uniref:hypothetical protein n=1 Tax=uncultured Brevundimonas sp. TaxID=213418 RepID=UPI0026235591|nr:hypothetical protein [uncultured Brevundimonas sp.]
MLSLALFMALAISVPQQRAEPPNPIVISYREVILCAGLTQAKSELEGGETTDGRRLYDAALYWSLTAIQLGGATGRPAERTEADMTQSRIHAVRQLNNRDAKALADLDKCLKSTPSLG